MFRGLLRQERVRIPRSGFALAYVFLLVVALLVFFTAVLVRAQHTLRATQFDFDTVQARALSETGAELAFNMLRENPNWFVDKEQPFKSEDFGSQFSSQALGGRFEIEILDREEADLEPDPFPPNGGTYKLIACRAFVRNREASTLLTIKLTSPLINFLVANRGPYQQLTASTVNGPVFIDTNRDTGELGDYQFCHNFLGAISGDPSGYRYLSAGRMEFGGEIRATGKIYLKSLELPLDRDPLILDGTLPAGPLTYDDVDETGVDSGTATGVVEIMRPSAFESNVPLGVDVPIMTNLLATYRSRLSDVEQVDVTSAEDGVLVEFLDSGEVLVSRGEWKSVGRCFDRSIYLTSKDSKDEAWKADYLRKENADYYPAAAEWVTRNEVAWDDPSYENAPYPNVLKQDLDTSGDGVADVVMGDDLNGDGVAEEGDYFEVKRLTRGTEIQRFGLSRSRWTVIYLSSSRADFPTADFPPKTTAPPVFVRGRVKGKCVLVYDAADDTIDPLGPDTHNPYNGTYTRFHMYIHGDHEMPGDSTRIAQAGGVPGGIHLVDSRLKTTPDDTGDVSEDYVLLLSRGSVRGSGLGGFNLSWLVRDDGSRRNYRKELADLDTDYAERYGSDDYRLHDSAKFNQDHATAHLDGIGIAHWSFHNRDRVLSDGRVVNHFDENGTRYADWESRSWSKMFGTSSLPAGVESGRPPILPDVMRAASAPISSEYRISGALHSVGVHLTTKGKVEYDYRWRDMSSKKIEQEIILPVGPLLLSRGSR